MAEKQHKLLIANRGEIAYRILRTAKRLGIPTVGIYTSVDAVAPHVLEADESSPVGNTADGEGADPHGYLDGDAIIEIAKRHGATLIAPGYGFLSENEDFARKCAAAGLIFLGPTPELIRQMGLKHEARKLAVEAGVPVVPGSELLTDEEEAVKFANKLGYPVMLKATAGGGGMGLQVCNNDQELRHKYEATQSRSMTLFKDGGVFLERYFPHSRHIEVQVFGNGKHVIHIGERECSVQRRHQKVIEETPSPFMLRHPDTRHKLCDAAVRLANLIGYKSAGTIEMLVDDDTGEFFFLEMNTRLQVEHAITEAVNPGLDIVELMIRQGIEESKGGRLSEKELHQERYVNLPKLHAFEARVYLENPTANFQPSPGLLQHVAWPAPHPWLRIDTWVETGTKVSPYYDPLVCKIIVTGHDRNQAIRHMLKALHDSQLFGPTSNMDYLHAIFSSDVFIKGNALTSFLANFDYVPHAMDVLVGGLSTTVQDYPGRSVGFGIPRSGPMDSLAFRAANRLVGNADTVEGLEITVMGPRLKFHVATVVAVTGAPTKVTVNKVVVPMWSRIMVPAGGILQIGTCSGNGFRVYLAVRGGFPNIPQYLGSKSTFAACSIGGVQGRPLATGDQIVLASNCGPSSSSEAQYHVDPKWIPEYPTDWIVFCVSGPQGDEGYVTPEGIDAFYETQWKISTSSNRMGLRLEGAKIKWSRENGGQGGSHPSNIIDNGYAMGSINVNGDTPVILTHDGPSMGGFLCMCTIVEADLWKLGQLRPGNTVQFRRISLEDARGLNEHCNTWLDAVEGKTPLKPQRGALDYVPSPHFRYDPKLAVYPADESTGRPEVVYRQAGDEYILIEFGPSDLDLSIRARIHLFELEITKQSWPAGAIRSLAPCIRSTIVHFDPALISQDALLDRLILVERALPATLGDQTFPSRVLHMPIVLDDPWCQACIDEYMRTTRDKATYLPSNVKYLADNNGLEGGSKEALQLLIQSEWLLLGLGFYLACPFLVPIDPRCRLIGAKMNPSRTATPEGAVGIAGLVAAIYPLASPGGYQLFGRTLSTWRTWGTGKGFSREKPWILEMFDRIKFYPVTVEEYEKLQKQVAGGTHVFDVREGEFSMKEYNAFVESIRPEIEEFKRKQAEGVKNTEEREALIMHEWEEEKSKAAHLHEGHHASGHSKVNDPFIPSSMTATCFKVKIQPGDILQDADQVVVILEAMKTEIGVTVGDDFVGKKVKAVLVEPGDAVSSGDPLVTVEDA
ncbi:urea amidolyase [Dacryopinax primogenitus]|uniref:Urea amidolyase n=1 Tax=Dacryopinax primogenitus (strain DJM 731) TaxID=1858805 RepID=M5G866_DACPD|nr:urea amidolyase [Dacryopinax primogenitus]EJU02057.1 urea amidolyase [Dacryopinax primogenitus]